MGGFRNSQILSKPQLISSFARKPLLLSNRIAGPAGLAALR